MTTQLYGGSYAGLLKAKHLRTPRGTPSFVTARINHADRLIKKALKRQAKANGRTPESILPF